MLLKTIQEIKKSKTELFLLFIILIISAYLRFKNFDIGYFSYHVTRDLYRAQSILTGKEIPLWGSELQYGGRTFGPFVYLLYAIPLAIHCTALSVTFFVAFVNFLCIVLTYIFTRQYFGSKAAIFAAAFYSCFPLDISQIRFYWNPVFLPAMILIFFWGIHLISIDKKQWGLPLSLFGFFMAFNVHFSALDVLPVLILAICLNGIKFKKRILIFSSLIVLLFILPPIVGSLKTRFSNVKEMIDAPWARQDRGRRINFNPYALKIFSHNLHFTINESALEQGFVNIGFVKEYKETMKENLPSWIMPLQKFGYIQLLFWITGFLIAFNRSFKISKFERNSQSLFYSPNNKAFLFLILWQMLPLLILSFFSFHVPIGSRAHSIIPPRYFAVTYPATFITMGIGVSYVIDFLKKKNMKIFQIVTYLMCFILILGESFFCAYYVNLMKNSGKAIPYGYEYVPTLREMMKVSSVLINEFKINADDYYSNVYSTGVFTRYNGEATLDWLVTQNPKSWENPSMAQNCYILIYEDKDTELPFDEKDVLKRVKSKDINIALIELAENETKPKLDNSMLRNWWINRMELRVPFWQR